ncbi:MAG TPA: NADAR family protein [Burkholderiaceae bacterium]
MVAGNLAKFGQDAARKAFLLGTGDKVLVEASPVDAIWGIGLAKDDSAAARPHEWKGENLLGFALMEVRESLRRS